MQNAPCNTQHNGAVFCILLPGKTASEDDQPIELHISQPRVMKLPISFGFASRGEGGCIGTQSCGSTLGSYESCCPQNSICQNHNNPVCCDTSDKNCTSILLPKPKCAKDTWTLYDSNQRGHFCCKPGTVGYESEKGDWSGCVGHGHTFEVTDTALMPIEDPSGGHLCGGFV